MWTHVALGAREGWSGRFGCHQRVMGTGGAAGWDGDLNIGWGLHNTVFYEEEGGALGDQHTAATGQKLKSSQEGGQQGLGGHGRGCGSINLRKSLPDHVGFKERRMTQGSGQKARGKGAQETWRLRPGLGDGVGRRRQMQGDGESCTAQG